MEFENYSDTSNVYDNYRVPVGLDNLQVAFKIASEALGKEVKDLKLLDVGCGTGNYLKEIKGKVKECYGVEFNEGMLAQCKTKIGEDKSIILQQGSVLELDKIFGENEFDVVIMTQMIHHLTADHHQKAIDQIARVVKPGGCYWINTTTPQQALCGLWFDIIIPTAVSKVAARMTNVPVFEAQLAKAGLELKSVDAIEEPLMKMEHYSDLNAPFSETFRKGDSSWSLATKEELDAGLAWWKRQIDSGEAPKIFEKLEVSRKLWG